MQTHVYALHAAVDVSWQHVISHLTNACCKHIAKLCKKATAASNTCYGRGIYVAATDSHRATVILQARNA